MRGKVWLGEGHTLNKHRESTSVPGGDCLTQGAAFLSHLEVPLPLRWGAPTLKVPEGQT